MVGYFFLGKLKMGDSLFNWELIWAEFFNSFLWIWDF